MLVVRNVKTSRLPVLSLGVQVINRSKHFWGPTICNMVSAPLPSQRAYFVPRSLVIHVALSPP